MFTLSGVVIGSILGAVGILEFVINCAVLVAIVKGGLWKTRGSPIYLLAANNLIIDNLQLLLNTLYLIPSITVQDWLFPGGQHDSMVVFLSGVFLFLWYNTSLCQVLMAINRVIAVCCPSVRKFSNKCLYLCCATVWASSFVLAVISQYVSPCCKFSFNYNYFSYSYHDDIKLFNYSNYFIDLPINTMCTTVCAVCYTCIWYQIHRSRVMVAELVSLNRSQKQKIKEYRYSIEFFWMSLVYSGGWIFFRIFPIFMGASAVEYYSIITLCLFLNCGANGIIFLNSNTEIRKELRKIFSKTPISPQNTSQGTSGKRNYTARTLQSSIYQHRVPESNPRS